jgi:hypothetical protein
VDCDAIDVDAMGVLDVVAAAGPRNSLSRSGAKLIFLKGKEKKNRFFFSFFFFFSVVKKKDSVVENEFEWIADDSSIGRGSVEIGQIQTHFFVS